MKPMQRLGFDLPEFTRFAWVSDRAREIWEPRLGRITRAWFDIEWRTVAAGVRRCAVILASPEEFVISGPEWARNGLSKS